MGVACPPATDPLAAATDCPLCQGAVGDVIVAGKPYSVVRCQRCGLGFTAPRPEPQALAACYGADYQPHGRCGLTQREIRRLWRWRFAPRWLRERNPVSHGLGYVGQRRLLDFGCGGGAFLHRMHLAGWQVTGLDLSASMVQRLGERLGLRVLAGSLPHAELAPQSFDVVTLWEALEHLPRPLEVLREVRRLLVPGGQLWLSVPNLAGHGFAWFGAQWIGLDLPRHLVHFTPDTLAAAVEAAGFRVRRLRVVRRPAWLAKTAAQASGTVGWQRWLRHRAVASLASCWSAFRGRGDCLLMQAVTQADRPAG